MGSKAVGMCHAPGLGVSDGCFSQGRTDGGWESVISTFNREELLDIPGTITNSALGEEDILLDGSEELVLENIGGLKLK